MKNALSFVVGVVAAIPIVGAMIFALLAGLAQEADNRSAQQLMRQLRPGITECTHPEARSFNCTEVKRGKRRTVVLAVAKE